MNLLEVDHISLLEQLDLGMCHQAQDVDGEAWTWEGVPLHKRGWYGKQSTESAVFIWDM